MTNLEERNQKIIDAVVKKANTVCPGALALIGIYGSFMTGDFHEKSDLDLLILINDDRHRCEIYETTGSITADGKRHSVGALFGKRLHKGRKDVKRDGTRLHNGYDFGTYV